MAKLHKLLGQSAFWIVNKHLARYFGDNDMALFISDMVDKQGYYTANDQLIEGKWWYSTAESTYEDTNIPEKRRRGYIQRLQKLEILEIKKMGLPCKTYFSLNLENLENLLEAVLGDQPNKFRQNDRTVTVETTGQVSAKRPDILYNNNKEIKIKNNNKNISANSFEFAVIAKKRKEKIDPSTPQTLIEFVDKCKASPQAHIRVIGEWAEAIEPKNTTVGEWNSFIRRHLRPAMLLAPYPIEKIEKAYSLLRRDLKEEGGYMTKFTLETVAKYIDNI